MMLHVNTLEIRHLTEVLQTFAVVHTVKRLRTPAERTRDCAAAMGLGCSPA